MSLVGYWKKTKKDPYNESFTIDLYLYNDNSYKYIKNSRLVQLENNVTFFEMNFTGKWYLIDNTIFFDGKGKVTNIETKDSIKTEQKTNINKDTFISSYKKKEFENCDLCDNLSINNYCNDCTRKLVKEFKYIKGDIIQHLQKAHKTGLWARNGLSITKGVPSISSTKFKN